MEIHYLRLKELKNRYMENERCNFIWSIGRRHTPALCVYLQPHVYKPVRPRVHVRSCETPPPPSSPLPLYKTRQPVSSDGGSIFELTAEQNLPMKTSRSRQKKTVIGKEIVR